MDNQFREVIKYDKKFTDMFSLGDLHSTQENMIYSIFGELRDRYKEGEELIFTYTELAVLSGKLFKSSRTQKMVGRTGKKFELMVEDLQEKMTEVIYKHPEKVVNGKIVAYTAMPLFKTFHVDHESKFIKIQISDAKFMESEILKDENGKPVLDEDGNEMLIQVEKQIKDLFNNDEWGRKAQYIQFGRDFHNLMKSQYTKRLFRFLADYRSTGFAIISAEKFEQEKMVLNTPSLLNTKNKKIQGAIDELNSYLLDDGMPVIKNLRLEKRKKGKKITHYAFSFEPFDDDLRRILSTEGKQITFADRKELDKRRQKAIVVQKFNEIFPKGTKYNNYHNSGYLKKMLEVMDYRLVLEALKRTGEDTTRTFGWTRSVLNSWEKKGIKTIEDLIQSGKSESKEEIASGTNNIPLWSGLKSKEELSEEEIVSLAVAEVEKQGEYPSEDEIREIIENFVNASVKGNKKIKKVNITQIVDAAIDKYIGEHFTMEQSIHLKILDTLRGKAEFTDIDYQQEEALVAEVKSWAFKGSVNLTTRKEQEQLDLMKAKSLERIRKANKDK